jgi:hypothetical protein
MKSKITAERLIYATIIVLAAVALALSLTSYQFTDTQLVYEGF